MDLIYGNSLLIKDANTFLIPYESLAVSLRGSWGSQDEPLNNRITLKVPYFPKTDTEPLAIAPIWQFYISDRLLVGLNQTMGFVLGDNTDSSINYYQPLPLSAKQNVILRYSSTPIRLTIMVASSSVIQGILSFHITRNVQRSVAPVAHDGSGNITADQTNAVALMNLATDRNITIDIPYDEWYSHFDYMFNSQTLQRYFRSLSAVALTPITSTLGEPAELYFTFLFSTGEPIGTGLIDAPNLTFMTRPMDNDGAKIEVAKEVYKYKASQYNIE